MVKKQYPNAMDYANFMGKYSRCVYVCWCFVVAGCLAVWLAGSLGGCLYVCLSVRLSSCLRVLRVSVCTVYTPCRRGKTCAKFLQEVPVFLSYVEWQQPL